MGMSGCYNIVRESISFRGIIFFITKLMSVHKCVYSFSYVIGGKMIIIFKKNVHCSGHECVNVYKKSCYNQIVKGGIRYDK